MVDHYLLAIIGCILLSNVLYLIQPINPTKKIVKSFKQEHLINKPFKQKPNDF